ncbi:hypothetical protein IU486_29850 [Streptomyces gardneri]|uniref:hypothetical protein n=1 Tax=Nocardia TaxID=1817 RepID=UPI00135AC5F8|nr:MULTISPECIES: hypothetical protein [Nocardia]MBF6168912.1 hypothetical protein [Streptomyces gardneri]MBF6205108.1 hypothetical protein [Streptomyces gardneri]
MNRTSPAEGDPAPDYREPVSSIAQRIARSTVERAIFMLAAMPFDVVCGWE